MAFKEITGDLPKAINLHEGDVVTGVLNNIKLGQGKDKKSSVIIIDDKHYWGSAMLNSLIERVPLKSKIRITCIKEKARFKNGSVGKMFKVEIDEEEKGQGK